MLSVNAVLHDRRREDIVLLERVLWLDARLVVLFDCSSDRAMPRLVRRCDLVLDIENGTIVAEPADPYAASIKADIDLSASELRVRSRRWQVIGPLVTDPEIPVLRESTRGRLICETANSAGATRKQIYTWLKLYWRHGQLPNALIPRFSRCGAPGTEKFSNSKLGRPRRSSVVGLEGCILTEADRRLLKRGAKRFFGEGLSLQEAFRRTKSEYFSTHQIGDDGHIVRVPYEFDRRPTLAQFVHHSRSVRDPQRELIAQKGETAFARNHRAVLGTSKERGFYPGAVYQIDATIGDIYLRSFLNPGRLIGRPVIYIVTDVYSTLIVGLYVGLAGPSVEGFMLALRSAFGSKVKFCEQLGIEIRDEDWPFGPCRELTGDRGPEVLAEIVEQAGKGLSFIVSNVAPCRPDWKAIVERKFRTINDELIHWQPGAVYKLERGDPDYRLDAKFTLKQFTALMVEFILYHNLYRPVATRPVGHAVLSGADPTPIDLWEYGVAHVGGPRKLDELRVTANCLPRAIAHETERGLRLRIPQRPLGLDLFYSLPKAETQHWFVRSPGRKWRDHQASYDPADMGRIFILENNGAHIETATLVGTCANQFKTASLEEIYDYNAWRSVGNDVASTERLKHKAEFSARVEALECAAAAECAEQLAGVGGQLTTSGIREARALEREFAARGLNQPTGSNSDDQPRRPLQLLPAPLPQESAGKLSAPSELGRLRRIRSM